VKTIEDQEVKRMALSDLAEGAWAVIESLELPAEIQNQLAHLGFMPEAPVTAVRKAPAGDPTVYRIDGAEVALRRETAQWIMTIPFPMKVEGIQS
jgi:Fe2+ transport system protein FeoA